MEKFDGFGKVSYKNYLIWSITLIGSRELSPSQLDCLNLYIHCVEVDGHLMSHLAV